MTRTSPPELRWNWNRAGAYLITRLGQVVPARCPGRKP